MILYRAHDSIISLYKSEAFELDFKSEAFALDFAAVMCRFSNGFISDFLSVMYGYFSATVVCRCFLPSEYCI